MGLKNISASHHWWLLVDVCRKKRTYRHWHSGFLKLVDTDIATRMMTNLGVIGVFLAGEKSPTLRRSRDGFTWLGVKGEAVPLCFLLPNFGVNMIIVKSKTHMKSLFTARTSRHPVDCSTFDDKQQLEQEAQNKQIRDLLKPGRIFLIFRPPGKSNKISKR